MLQQPKVAEALLASFGVPTVSEIFKGPSKFVVDGVVPAKQVRCYASETLPAGLRCACSNCDPDAFADLEGYDEDDWDFE